MSVSGNSISTIYRPGAMTTINKPSSSLSVLESKDIRILKNENDNIRKELVRKDTRIESLQKEINNIRTIYSNQQRELRLLTSSYDKINTTNNTMINDLIRAKEYINKLENQLTKYSDNININTYANQLSIKLDDSNRQLNQCTNIINDKDERIQVLERELEIFKRSFDIQTEYERSLDKNGNRETLRSLYFEIGKRQTDAHSLALSLSELNEEKSLLDKEYKTVCVLKDELQNNVSILTSENEQLKQQVAHNQQEIILLNDKINITKDINAKFTAQIEDLSHRLTEARISYEAQLQEKNRTIAELSEVLPQTQRENEALRVRIETLQHSLSHLDSVNQLTEQRINSEWDILAAEKEAIAEKLSMGEAAQQQSDLLRKRLTDTLEAKEKLQEKYQQLKEYQDRQQYDENKLLITIQDNENLLHAAKAKELKSQAERDDALKALMQTVDATRELSEKYQKERSRRIAAEERALASEHLADGLRRAKEHVSTAVLDALHKERSKNAALEQALRAVSIDRKYDVSFSNDVLSTPSSILSTKVNDNQSPLSPLPRPPLAFINSDSNVNNIDDNDSNAKISAPVLTMVEELKKLRDELQRIEDIAPSPLSQSYSQSSFSNTTTTKLENSI